MASSQSSAKTSNPHRNSTYNSNLVLTSTRKPFEQNKEQLELLLGRQRQKHDQRFTMSTIHLTPRLSTTKVNAPFGIAECSHCASDGEGKDVNIGDTDFSTKIPGVIVNTDEGKGLVVRDSNDSENMKKRLSESLVECGCEYGDSSDVCDVPNWAYASFTLSSPSSITYESPLNFRHSGSESSHEAPLHVTRAGSECSWDEHTFLNHNDLPGAMFGRTHTEKKALEDQIAADYWSLRTDVLAAECKLLRVEKELVMRRWKHECGGATIFNPIEQVLEATPKSLYEVRSTAPNSREFLWSQEGGINCRPLHPRCYSDHFFASSTAYTPVEDEDALVTSEVRSRNFAFANTLSRSFNQRWANEAAKEKVSRHISNGPSKKDFTLEALKDVERSSHEVSTRIVQHEDPTKALGKRLEGLALAAQTSALEDEMQSSSKLRSHHEKDTTGQFEMGRVLVTTVCNTASTEVPASKKQSDFIAAEPLQTKDAYAYIQRQCRSMLSGEEGLYPSNGMDKITREEMYCRNALKQIVAQVEAESEQWSQVQDIVCSLQEEMENLIEMQGSLENRALCAETQVQYWRCRVQTAEEEARKLRSENQTLKLRVQHLTTERAVHCHCWNERLKNADKSATISITDAQPAIIYEAEEQPRPANVGMQEDCVLCESIVHSREESSRSSMDLGSTSIVQPHKNIKKSLDFSNVSSSEGKINKSRMISDQCNNQNHKIQSTRFNFCDVNKRPTHYINGAQIKTKPARVENQKPTCGAGPKERKKIKGANCKENLSRSGPLETCTSFPAELLMQSSLGQHGMTSAPDLLEHLRPSRSKKSLPMAPTSTPARLPFSEIFNSPS
ncbi:hypothetical protein KP509_33G047700 [Ceratopteris richardii]|uniref:Uncharacterized protein n=1 Tax=Ceratopteris richardii TaxID=49495 RepID=A0A8T2QQQ8_CERRI|nr:hypothetical protein KP509_33G047700 [Ceratopteris richardii]